MSFLSSLYEYAQAHSLDKDAYFKETEIEWLLCVDEDLSVHLERLNGPRKGRGYPFQMPIPLKRTVNCLANFPVDNGAYVLGLKLEDEKKNRSDPDWHMKCHEAYSKLLEKVSGETGDHDLRLVSRALLKHFGTFHSLPYTQNVTAMDAVSPATFRDGRFRPIGELPAARAWWIKNYPILQKMVAARGVCMVTGKESDLARLHPLVTGVDGGKSTGVTLVTFNSPSSESFGKTQGMNAPISVDAAILASAAMSSIVSRQSGRRRSIEVQKGLHVSFIAKKESEEEAAKYVLSLLDPVENDFLTASKEEVSVREKKAWQAHRMLFDAPQNGVQSSDPDTAVDILVTRLRPGSARFEVMDFQKNTFGDTQDHLRNYFRGLEIMDPWTCSIRSDFPIRSVWPKWDEKKPAKFPIASGLLDSLKGDPNKSKGPRPDAAAGFFLTAISGRPLPAEIFSLTVHAAARAARNGKGIPAIVAALLKFQVNYNYTRSDSHIMYRWRSVDSHFKGVNPMLDPMCAVPSYVLGRLMAVAERIQEIAIPGVTSSVVKRLYDGASKFPATIMPAVIKDMNHHIAKISRSKPGLAIWCQRDLVAPILGLLGADKNKAFPRCMDMQDQAMFGLGYYHQRTDLFTKKEKPQGNPEPLPEMATT
jgi:CRISPR-associated protein Csd1